MYRVAITGIGIVSSLGNDIETVADSLCHGKSGIVSFYNLDIVGKNVVLASSNYKNELISFFNTWKIPIKIYTINIKNIESLSFNE
jgi:3-oxoacyl-(acyl-carrier-protein) synthase